MMLRRAESYEVEQILRETFDIWSPGLTRDQYRQYIFSQMTHPWSRKHFEYLILQNPDGPPFSSLKYYRIFFMHAGKTYNFIGLGAIYAAKRYRKQGYGRRIIELAIEKARSEGCDGILLFSDIDPKYYAKFGFADLGNKKFYLELVSGPLAKGNVLVERIDVRPELIDKVDRYYRRWLCSQQFGVVRSPVYWHFKLWREMYLFEHSRLAWPALELISLNNKQSDSGYCLIEHGGNLLRILEMVASESAYGELWKAAIMRAQELQIRRISGWESILSALGPGFSLRQLTTLAPVAPYCRSIGFVEKTNGRSMILPLNPEVSRWMVAQPTPILELDHL
ncbi:MAG: GNAT family N-acetyltransferase [Cyanobacteria bacterium]|nr:GNAT family N-acetyltransferase [Cyanobacteriota bacterium]